jgi:colanic acid/amylovoran biosynthesis glycosyltransferase
LELSLLDKNAIDMNDTLILLTDSFPYGIKETFLEAEIGFLSDAFKSVHIFPLHGSGEYRRQAANVTVHSPFLSFHTKNQKQLFISGLCNKSPYRFAIKECWKKAIYKNPSQFRVWMAATLVFRAAYSNHQRMSELKSLIGDNSVVYSYWGDKLALMIPFLSKNRSYNNVVRFHRTDLYEEFKAGYIPFRSLLLPTVGHFAFISEDGQNYLSKRYPAWVHNAHICRLGVFDNGINPVNFSLAFHLVSCSYMVPVKRIPLLIEALQKLEITVKWTHIGTGSEYDRICNLANQLPSNIDVELLGERTNHEVLSYYASTPIDLFVNVSESEGVPVSIMEALSFGIPVMATAVGGTAEIVDDEVGKLLPLTISAQQLAEEIQAFCESTQAANKRFAARKRWSERCDAEKIYSKFAEFVRTI